VACTLDAQGRKLQEELQADRVCPLNADFGATDDGAALAKCRSFRKRTAQCHENITPAPRGPQPTFELGQHLLALDENEEVVGVFHRLARHIGTGGTGGANARNSPISASETTRPTGDLQPTVLSSLAC
jgi:hypothetical protein